MHFSENEGIEGKTFVVTGGLGHVGSAICFELVRRGARQVRAFDLRSTSPWSHDLHNRGVQCIQGDIVQKKDVERSLRGTDCVFHLASFGMSGKEMLQLGRVDEVNITGTCHIIDACLELGIERLVYVSTYNVVFGGKKIVNGDENLPYFPIDDHVDAYGRSKSVAEQLVLKNNGRAFKEKNGKCLYTCAVRPAAIYGPGEERHLPSMGLLDDIPGKSGRPIAAGQPYFVSDGCPVNSFEFIGNFLKGLDYELPKYRLALPHALFIGRIFSVFYSILYPWLNRWWLPQPLMLPTEVYKVGVTHYFSFAKAKEELGYVPMVTPKEGMAAIISYWQDRKRKSLEGPTIFVWLFVIIGMSSLFAAAYLPDIMPVSLIRALSLFFFRSMWTIRLVFVMSIAAHLGEGAYAWYLAKRVDPANARGWFWQTFALGFFSLRFLLKRARK
ncbi:hypothetical protein Q3G72_029603 [Acer saccharum]|nr:hypothetical protein Q3G72_029603 [Acer saccharum]